MGPGTPLKFKSGTPGPPSKFKSGTPSPFFNELIFFRIFHRFFIFVSFLNKIYTKKNQLWVNTSQVHLKTKILSEETEQNPSELKPHWSNNTLGLPSLRNPFRSISVRRHSHTEVPKRNVQWTFMGRYLNYMYVFVCGNCLAKTYCFLPSIGQLTKPNFFSAKYMFAVVPTKEYSMQNSAFCLSQKL